MKKSFIVSIIVLSSIVSFSQTTKWDQRALRFARCGYNTGIDVAFDATGNTYALIQVANPITNPSSCLNQNDLKVEKFNTSGASVASFNYDINGKELNDTPISIKRDAQNNLFVLGEGDGFVYLLKLNSSLTLLWEKKYYNVSGAALVVATNAAFVIANDPAGAIILKYRKTDGVLLDYDINLDAVAKSARGFGNALVITGTKNNGANGLACFTAQYDTTVALTWEKLYNGQAGTTDDRNIEVQIVNGNVYVLGQSYKAATGNDYVVIKYNATGTAQWTKRFNYSGTSNDSPADIQVDAFNEDVYFAGITTANNKYIVYKLNSSGTQQWRISYANYINSSQTLNALAIDGSSTVASSNVFVAGDYYASSPNLGSGARYQVVGFKTSTGAKIFVDSTNFFSGNSNLKYRELKINNVGPNKELVALGGGYTNSSFSIDDQEYDVKCYNNIPLGPMPAKLSSAASDVEWNVFPNPVNNILELENVTDEAAVRIYNVLGNIVYYKSSEEKYVAIDCSSFNAGMYIIEIAVNNISSRKSFIKN